LEAKRGARSARGELDIREGAKKGGGTLLFLGNQAKKSYPSLLIRGRGKVKETGGRKRRKKRKRQLFLAKKRKATETESL